MRVARFNQREFLRAGPAFDLFFSGQSGVDVLGFLNVE